MKKKYKYRCISKVCRNSLLKEDMPSQASVDYLEPCPKLKEFGDICPTELMLVLKIILFIFIIAKYKGAQHGWKEQCVPVLADFHRYYQLLLKKSVITTKCM